MYWMCFLLLVKTVDKSRTSGPAASDIRSLSVAISDICVAVKDFSTLFSVPRFLVLWSTCMCPTPHTTSESIEVPYAGGRLDYRNASSVCPRPVRKREENTGEGPTDKIANRKTLSAISMPWPECFSARYAHLPHTHTTCHSP